MKTTKNILLVLTASALTVTAAETNLFNPGSQDPTVSAKTWTGNANYGPWGKENPTGSKDGKSCVEYTFTKGWQRIQGGGLTEVNPSSTYKVKVALKGKEGISFRMGIYCFDKNKQIIDVMHNASLSDPVYTLAADAKKGSKTITLDTPVSYQHHWAVAFNAKKDGSDIPNRNTVNLIHAPKKVTGKILNLDQGLPVDYQKGTVVRLQQRKELAFRNVNMTGDWKDFSFHTVKDRALAPYVKYITIFLQTGFKETQTVLIGSPLIEKAATK